MVEVELTSVRVDLRSNTPLILLREKDEPHRSLPIFIGAPEASAIAMAQRGFEAPRPLTHDLLVNTIDSLGAHIERIEVVDLVDSTYYADIYLSGLSGSIQLSARPSDAVALAVRVNVPIFVNEDLMEREGVIVSEDGEEEETQDSGDDQSVLSEFREFLDKITPEDFS